MKRGEALFGLYPVTELAPAPPVVAPFTKARCQTVLFAGLSVIDESLMLEVLRADIRPSREIDFALWSQERRVEV